MGTTKSLCEVAVDRGERLALLDITLAKGKRMAQLVGQRCVNCGDRLGSELDAHFCPSCGQPVHTRDCAPIAPDHLAQRCPICKAVTLEQRSLLPEKSEWVEDKTGDRQGGYRVYADVPWYRRSGINSLFLLVQLATCGLLPLTLVVCFNLLTGEVYYDRQGSDGRLQVWSAANKVVALFILVANFALLVRAFRE